jgi:predicted metal-dependent phosphoesterase TrpH
MKADLHVHSTASDGTWDPGQLVVAATKAGIRALAVTDHDNTANVEKVAELAQAAGIKFVHGVEINTTKDGHNYHVLAYGIDVHNKELQELCAHNRNLMEENDKESIAMLISRGWPLDMQEYLTYTYDAHRGGWKGLAFLQDHKLCTDVNDFFQHVYTAENNLGFPEFPSIGEVVKIIHGAGGIALCAHVASDFHGPGLQECLPRLVEEKLDGFECYHSGHTPEAAKLLAHYCQRHKLCISGGSDCHGTFVPSRHLGVPDIETEALNMPGLL